MRFEHDAHAMPRATIGPPRRSAGRPRSKDIRPPVHHEPSRHLLARMLEGPLVSRVSFTLGHVQVRSADFRAVAAALRSGMVTIRVDPTELATTKALATYSSEANEFVFSSTDLLRDDVTTATVFHECVHAACDAHGGRTAALSEEAAAFTGEAWFLILRGHEDSDAAGAGAPPQAFFDIAADLEARRDREGAPVRATAAQINGARRAYRDNFDEPDQTFYENDGV